MVIRSCYENMKEIRNILLSLNLHNNSFCFFFLLSIDRRYKARRFLKILRIALSVLFFGFKCVKCLMPLFKLHYIMYDFPIAVWDSHISPVEPTKRGMNVVWFFLL